MATYPVPTASPAGRTVEAIFRFCVELAQAIRLLMRGKLNCVGAAKFTLGASVATTTLTDERLTSDGVVFFDPLTLNAAAELAAGTMYVLSANRLVGVWTVTHANNAQTDRDFRILIIG